MFSIQNNLIKIEYYHEDRDWGFRSFTKEGEILNDTTFVIKESYRTKDGSEAEVLNETYHFMKLEQKPDSVNEFVK